MMKKNNVRAVLFDFAGTLVDGYLNLDACREAAVSFINEQGYRITKGEYIAALEQALEVARKRRRLELETPFSAVIKDTLSRVGLEATDTLTRSIEDTDYRFYRWTLKPGVKEAITNLHRRVLLGVVSNSWTDSVVRVLTDSKLSNYFKTIVLSKNVGYRKPNSVIYLRAIEDLGVRADQIIFVGDNYVDDVIGPASVGMMQIWIGKSSKYGMQDIPLMLSGWTGELSTIRTADTARIQVGRRRAGLVPNSKTAATRLK